MTMRRLGAGAALALAVAACGSSGGSSGGSSSGGANYQGKTLQFGEVLSLTGAGAVYGPSSQKGAELAVGEINSSGGVSGAKITLTTLDDGSDKAQSAQVAQQLIQQQQVLAFLGPTLSNSAVAVHPLAESLHTPVVGVSNTGINIVPNCNYPKTIPCKYVFRDSLGEQTAIPANIQSWVKHNSNTKTGVLLVAKDDKFSADGGEVVKQSAPQYHIQLVKTIEFSKNDADLSLPVTEAVQANPDVIFITSLGGIPAKIMSTARSQGFKGEFLGGNGFNTAVVSKQAGQDGKNAESGSAWYIGNTFHSNAAFVTAYRNKYGADPDQFAAQGYAGIYILADAAKRGHLTFSNLSADRDSMRAALESVNIDTPLGPFQFTKTHDVKQPIWIVKMDGNGGFTLVDKVQPS